MTRERKMREPSEPLENPFKPDERPEKTVLDLQKRPAAPKLTPKVSTRRDWLCDVTIDGITYGPFTQNAVDESEAIQRLNDSHAALHKAAWKAKWSIRPADAVA